MKITTDWHIHTKCSCDSACMEFETLVSDAKELGITDFGVSDHYHTILQEPDIAASRKEFDSTLERHPELRGHFHFGIETTLVSAWEADKIRRGEYTEPPIYGFRQGGPKNAPVIFDMDEEFLTKYGVEYFIAGMHWPMYCDTDVDSVLYEYHRQYMYAITHPFTDIVAHYQWYDTGVFPGVDNPFVPFDRVPQSMRDEIKSALLDTGVAFEVNAGFLDVPVLPDSYRDDYLGWVHDLQNSGVILSFGCDCHRPNLHACDVHEKYARLFDHYKIDTAKFWTL